jgi:hypothetical protein
MDRIFRFDRRRGIVGRNAKRVISATLALLLIVMAVSVAEIGQAPAAVSAQAKMPVTASVAPATTLLYVAIDLNTTSPQYKKATELLHRVGANVTVEDLAGQMSSAMTGGNATDAAQVQALLGGEAGVAVFDFGSNLSAMSGSLTGNLGVTGLGTPEPSATSTGSSAVIISAPNPDAAFAAAETALKNNATNQGATVSETTYEGVKIESIPASASTSGSTGSALARVGDFVVLGSKASDIEPVIDTHAGKTPSLADSADFKKVAAELNTDWLLLGHVNGSEMAKQLAKAGASGVNVSTMNLAQLKSDSGFVVWADDPGFRFDSITIPAPGSTTNIPANFTPEFPLKVPEDTLFLADGADLGKSGFLDAIFLSALGSLTGSVGGEVATPNPAMSPQEVAQQQFAQLQTILGFNIKTDFIDQLVGEWGIAAWGFDANAVSKQDYSGVRLLMVSKVQTPATVSDAVSKLSLLLQAGLAGRGSVTTKLIGQDQINVLTIASTTGAKPVTIEYGVVNGTYVLSLNNAIADFVASGGTSLADKPDFQAAIAALPAAHNGFFYLDLTQAISISQASAQATAQASASSTQTVDASEKCAAYSTQAAAQAAFDADPSANADLDQNFNGQACEDYFKASTPEAVGSPEANRYAALKSLTAVTYQRNGMNGVSALLLIQQ